MPRVPRPEDLYGLRVPTEVALSPDGRWVCFSVKAVAPGKDGYRTSLWIVPADGSEPARQLTLGATNDSTARWSPDGRTLAFLSDRGAVLIKGGAANEPGAEEPKEGRTQVWLLPMEGGEARQASTLPRDVTDMAWSPDGGRLCLVSGALQATEPKRRREPTDPPDSDIHLIDRLGYQLNGAGYRHDRPNQLWLLDIDTDEVRRLTRGRTDAEGPAWSPDGRRVAFQSDRRPDADLYWRSDIYTVDVESGRVERISGGRGEQSFVAPRWSPDGRWLAALGHRYPAAGGSRTDVWRFRPVAEHAGEDLTAESDLDAAAGMASDLFGGFHVRVRWTGDGRWIVFAAPFEGSYELWRVEVDTRRIERITEDRHYLSRFDLAPLAAGRERIAAVRAAGSEPPQVVSLDLSARRAREPELRRLTDLTGADWADIELVEPVSRWHEVDGRRVQGWFLEAGTGGRVARGRRRSRPAPLVVQIHGGPQALYGWSLFWEWQCLVAAGMSVYACNPRGSEGYGQAFKAANIGDWGDGPMRDVLGGVDALIEEGLADPDRLGVTGGSYGGYLTSWIVGHTDRFHAAVSCRSVNDMTSQMLSGDIGGPQFGRLEYRTSPWQDPDLYRAHSPLTYADRIRTPLLIQHSDRDLRTPITQAEELFTVLRSLRRPVRLMRVPEETHELTRSGTPYRRVENLRTIVDWFRHYLVDGKRRLPPLRMTARQRRSPRQSPSSSSQAVSGRRAASSR
jgi:dipeptidyl aminopeptidase/acylaminoacyl peptidase